MYAILARTVLLYVLVTVAIRAMGKRQVGELEMSELVTTLLLSQLATLPIEDPEIPLAYVTLPLFLIVSFEIVITFLKSRVNFLKKIFESRPSILVDRGVIDQAELGRMRITVDELLSEVRQQGYRDIREIEYAILEENGKFSLLPRMETEPPTRADTGMSVAETGCAFPLVADGVIDRDLLHRIGRDEAWLREVCRQEGTAPEELFLMTVDDTGAVSLTRREPKK
ncbi:MAG: DUF421 domain-containing protein [Clostridia bacterium]|nr:DUF421 domain-containing protein [Clostridia bacterium]